MKKLLLLSFLFIAALGVKAQVSDGYLTDGDIVTISHNNHSGQTHHYLEISSSGFQTVDKVSINCLWRIGITKVNNQYEYSFKHVERDQYLSIKNNGNQNYSMQLAASASTFRQNEANNNAEKSYLLGKFYYNILDNWGSTMAVYLNWEGGNFYYQTYWGHAVYIEKWEQVGGGDAAAHFNPNKIEFTYAKDDNAAQAQKQIVNFVLEGSTESYYECINRKGSEMIIHLPTSGVDSSKVSSVKLYWKSTNPKSNVTTLDISQYASVAATETVNRPMMTVSEAVQQDDKRYWQFTITPHGQSPMGLKEQLYESTPQWVDYADILVAEYVYNGKTLTHESRIVRKAYHEEELTPITFSINPVTYTFSLEGERREFAVTLSHQHGSVIYNVDNQVVAEDIDYDPVRIPLSEFNDKFAQHTWEKSYRFLHQGEGNQWLTLDEEEFNVNNLIFVTAAANNGAGSKKRSDTLVVTLKNVSDYHPHEASFMIPLSQRSIAGGIKFKPNKGQSGDNLVNDRQQVHTAERIIYYLSGEDVELRLPESGYSGYMRWYDYETNGDPYYNNAWGKASTSWILSPRAANGNPFSAINTPKSAQTVETEGYSHGLYAINKADGGILDEDNTNNPAPVLKGWDYTNKNDAYHTMACDVSAYTDYRIWYHEGNATRIDSIQEPTLSYRQLFHLRPASDMADKFKDLAEGEFLETYSYQAPAGKNILLSTEYRYRKYRSHVSEMCYFHYGTDNKLYRVDGSKVKWYESTLQNDGTWSTPAEMTNPTYSAELDYLIVNSDRYPVQKRYTLVLPARVSNGNAELRIASFEVKFVDREVYGPTEKIIITQQRIEADYDVLATINFDKYDSHLPWNYTSYGYVYDVEPLNDNGGKYKRGASQGVFPYYGEYTVVESVNKDWAKSSAHSGKALYVDGTMEPGLVATIAAPTNICSGQNVYCSAWFRNPTPSGWGGDGQSSVGNPIFRCNIQGKNETGEWEDAGVYFVGELLKNTEWQQVVFPIASAHSYDSTRVSIYNFATTNNGNDFLVDDINLYVSRLPIAAYQGKMACRSTDDENTRAAAILRLDYTNINTGDARYMYYQIFNESYKQGNVSGASVSLEGEAAYFHEAHLAGEHEHSDFGSVGIPAVDFNPEKYNADLKTSGQSQDTVMIYYSVSKLLDDMVANNWLHAKAYVKTENSGVVKWLLYVAHLIDNTTDEAQALSKLYDEHTYVMRMAYTPDELPTAECNLTTPIHATQQTVFTLRNSDKKTIMHNQASDGTLTAEIGAGVKYIFKQSYGNCANDLYFLTSTVVNHLAVEGAGGNIDPIAAPIYSDWLVGDPKGDVLSETPPATNDPKYQDYLERLQASIAGFKEMYGYTHGQVSHAIMYDMRRVPTEDERNPNYSAKTFEELDPAAFESLQNYEIVKHLYENGWLHLYDTDVHFYLGSQDTARYWCFPIAETAKVTIDGKEYTLKDCNEPHRVMVTSVESDYQLNVAPILKKDKTPQQKIQLPSVKVLADASHNITSVTLPIKEIASGVRINQSSHNDGDNITINLNNSLPNYISFFDLDKGQVIAAPSSLEIGQEYTMRLAFQKEGGALWLGTENESCRVGYIFFTIQVVPNTLVWTPEGHSFNGWGKNENWRGWKDDGDFVIEEGELTKGFVPMAGSNVVIPNLGNEILYPYIVPEHEHDHYPMTVHHDQHRCENIYFAPGAMIQNQHLLHYERAFVDMPLTAGSWHMMSAPLQDMYSGDMFIPHSGGKSVEYANPFEVSKFRGQRSSTSTYAFWASYYNQTVNTWFDNGTTEEVAAAAKFNQSNGLNQALLPASGYLLWGEGQEQDLVVRLPKPDKVYYSSGGNQVSVQRANSGKFAFTATHENQQMNITLTNKVASQYFVFGNPTMAYINMAQFLQEHSSVLTGNVYRIDNGSWTATAEQTMRSNEKYLAPMTSVMLEAIAEQTSLNLTLTPSVLTLNDQVAAQSPARRVQERRSTSTCDSDLTSEILTIYAITPNAHARTLIATHPEAYDYYVQSEDALLMTSGVQTSSYVTIPLNLYTAAEQVPMMADVRQGISRIPLSMIVYPEYRTEYMQLAFYLTNNWTRECYIVDSYTGQRIRIMDGLIITVEMPADYEERYFIEGPDEYLGAGNNQGNGTTTNLDNATTAEPMLRAYSVETGQLTVSASQPIRDMKVYSITGQLLYTTLANCQLSTIHCSVPSGACIVEARLHTGSTLYQQAIVK